MRDRSGALGNDWLADFVSLGGPLVCANDEPWSEGDSADTELSPWRMTHGQQGTKYAGCRRSYRGFARET